MQSMGCEGSGGDSKVVSLAPVRAAVWPDRANRGEIALISVVPVRAAVRPH